MILELANKFGIELTQRSPGIWSSVKHPSLLIWEETNSFYWFSRSIPGGPKRFLEEVVGLTPAQIHNEIGNVIADPLGDSMNMCPYDYKTLGGVLAIDNPYLEKRMVNNDTVMYFGIRANADGVIIPLRNTFGEEIGTTIRHYVKEPKYKLYLKVDKKPFFYSDNPDMFSHYDKIIIYEGYFSVIRTTQVSRENNLNILSVALIGTLGYKRYKELSALLNGLLHKVTFVPDPDPPGIAVLNKEWMKFKYKIPPGMVDDMNDEELLEFLTNV